MADIVLKHDGEFDIAIGKNRKSTNWKNQEKLWSWFVDRVSETVRTAETIASYKSDAKPRQDEIKDIGGYVGGYLNGGRRKSNNVVHRQLITLDIDHCKHNLWDDYLITYGHAACMYTTHKHEANAPRLRLIIPLDRPVFSDEYVAIARKIAGNLGIDNFDHTTFEPARLMYWPSTSKDGEFLFDYHDGPWLCADDVLASYHDWKDASQWPVSEKFQSALQRSIKKQGDPLEKPGVVGAFCKTYSIEEAIEKFLSEVYEPCDIPGRYTYREGSTAGGLVIYEDRYTFSHHGTDPTSGKLCNAFDLVRLHKYGLKDEDAREGTPGNKLPSYTAMIEFAVKDGAVRKQLGAERLAEALQEFDGINIADYETDEDNADWLASLDTDKKGNYFSTVNNVVTIINNDPYFKNKLALNEFENLPVVKSNLPWRKVNEDSRHLVDIDDAHIRHYLEKAYNISSLSKIKDAIDIVLSQHAFHPVRDYLNGVAWDGRERLDTILIDYLGAEDTDYVRTVSRKTFVAAVARVFVPGIKFDNMLVLVGPQGIGKSTLIDKMAGLWFSDSFGFHMVKSKEANEQLRGVWVMEAGELNGIANADLDAVKNFVARRIDRFREAFGKRLAHFRRQCIFIGTTNNPVFLKDKTGNRRFWPVTTALMKGRLNVWDDLTEQVRGQLWAEAVYRWKHKETLVLSEKIEAAATQAQKEYTEVDDRAGKIVEYLEMPVAEDWETMTAFERSAWLSDEEMRAEGTRVRGQICAAEIWVELFRGQLKDMNNFNTKFIHDIMQNLPGWRKAKATRKFAVYGYQRCYVKIAVSDILTENSDKHTI